MRHAIPWVLATAMALAGATPACGQGEDRPGIVTSDDDDRPTSAVSTTTTTTTQAERPSRP